MTQAGKEELYVLLFQSAYLCAPTGGNVLAEKLKRTDLPEDDRSIAEAWEICDNEEHSSTVINGPLQGNTLRSLFEKYGPALVGAYCRTPRFPLEVKILNVQKKLPLFVQPSPAAASAIAGAAAGSKFWYILSAEKDARIMAGIQVASSRMRFLESYRNHDAESQMQIFDSFANDSYYIPGGRLHSIGAGNLILEISTSSGSVYTLDNRSGSEEEKRYSQEALSCVDFMDRTVSRIAGASDLVARNRKFPVINRCSSFHAEELLLVSDWHDNTAPGNSFHILSAVQGSFNVGSGEGDCLVTVPEGCSCLVPACYGAYNILPLTEENTQCRIIKTSLSSL